mmetsp:Transcript_21018/g.43208  ORF Transcript_21018/g.43208 Transcript_21018/m.43208 type:complete len:205 (-) Transcript_21018:226-840(-)
MKDSAMLLKVTSWVRYSLMTHGLTSQLCVLTMLMRFSIFSVSSWTVLLILYVDMIPPHVVILSHIESVVFFSSVHSATKIQTLALAIHFVLWMIFVNSSRLLARRTNHTLRLSSALDINISVRDGFQLILMTFLLGRSAMLQSPELRLIVFIGWTMKSYVPLTVLHFPKLRTRNVMNLGVIAFLKCLLIALLKRSLKSSTKCFS